MYMQNSCQLAAPITCSQVTIDEMLSLNPNVTLKPTTPQGHPPGPQTRLQSARRKTGLSPAPHTVSKENMQCCPLLCSHIHFLGSCIGYSRAKGTIEADELGEHCGEFTWFGMVKLHTVGYIPPSLPLPLPPLLPISSSPPLFLPPSLPLLCPLPPFLTPSSSHPQQHLLQLRIRRKLQPQSTSHS